jgi:ribosomal 50S subunit-recycling heat shock protein
VSDAPAGRGAGVRLDLFLRNTGLVKRRGNAHDACEAGRVLVDGKPARAGARVHRGQVLRLDLPWRFFEGEILCVPAHPVPKHEREGCFRVMQDRVPAGGGGEDEDGMTA